ncbi:DeoR family transcriptional regulator [bacterium]|nr:DeoR family transcriptional regulator [bacterium]
MNNISKNLSRQEQILGMVKDKYKISIDELAKMFNVTHMTIYRDLEFLENENNYKSGGISTHLIFWNIDCCK